MYSVLTCVYIEYIYEHFYKLVFMYYYFAKTQMRTLFVIFVYKYIWVNSTHTRALVDRFNKCVYNIYNTKYGGVRYILIIHKLIYIYIYIYIYFTYNDTIVYIIEIISRLLVRYIYVRAIHYYLM